MALVEKRIYHISDSDLATNLNALQLGVQDTADSDLGFKMWAGKDDAGSMTYWLAKDNPGRLTLLSLTGPSTTGSAGVLQHDTAGAITGDAAHNILTSKQGGTAGEYYHLTASEHATLTTSTLVNPGVVYTNASGNLETDATKFYHNTVTGVSAWINGTVSLEADSATAASASLLANGSATNNVYIQAYGGSLANNVLMQGDTLAFKIGGSTYLYAQSGYIWTLDNTPFVIGSSAPTTDAALINSTVQTVDSTIFALDNTSRSLIFCERADVANDFGFSAQTNPTLFFLPSDIVTYSGYYGTLSMVGDDLTLTSYGGNDNIYVEATNSVRLRVDSAARLTLWDSYLHLNEDIKFLLGFTTVESTTSAMVYSTLQTNDALLVGLGTASKSLVLCDYSDMDTDLSLPVRTNPALYFVPSDVTNGYYGYLTQNDDELFIRSNQVQIQAEGSVILAPDSGTYKIQLDSTRAWISDAYPLVFGSTSADDTALVWDTAQTVDALVLGVSETGRSVVICDRGDVGTDFGLASQANPTLYMLPADSAQATTYGHYTYLRRDSQTFSIRTQSDDSTNPCEMNIVTQNGTSGDADYGYCRIRTESFEGGYSGASMQFELETGVNEGYVTFSFVGDSDAANDSYMTFTDIDILTCDNTIIDYVAQITFDESPGSATGTTTLTANFADKHIIEHTFSADITTWSLTTPDYMLEGILVLTNTDSSSHTVAGPSDAGFYGDDGAGFTVAAGETVVIRCIYVNGTYPSGDDWIIIVSRAYS